jgi:outer membrane murein-binding lipoprotein Lpp
VKALHSIVRSFSGGKNMKKLIFLGPLALSVILLGGCSVSQRSIDDAQNRVNDLKAKGVPDSSLSDAVKYLYGASYAKQKDEKTMARKSMDSARILIAQAEALYSENAARMKPYSDSVIAVLTKAKSEFTGLQLKKLDSAMTVINSFVTKSWVYQIEDNCQKTLDLLPILRFNEARAKELKERLPGEWVCTNVTKSDADKAINAVEKKVFAFFKDGKVKLVETKKGQSAKNLKEDWEFQSYGTWDCLGDTIQIFVDRFACMRQNFQTLMEKEGKKNWEAKKEPTYDSLITDHSQDRWIPFSEMSQDFKQEKKL